MFNKLKVLFLRWMVDRYLARPWRAVDTASAVDVERVDLGRFALKIYRPRHHRADKAICYFHGGGFVLGSLKCSNQQYEDMADRLGVVIVAVGYRLAPEHPFPAAVEDAREAVEWCLTHTAELGVDHVYVGGDSAGGNLAAVSALYYPRELAGQILLYPVIYISGTPTQSALEFAEGYGLTRSMMAWFWFNYFPQCLDQPDPDAFPIMHEDAVLSCAPPCFVVTAGFDILRDEGNLYAERLNELGVAVEHTCFEHAHHGFFGGAGPDEDYCKTADMIRDWMSRY